MPRDLPIANGNLFINFDLYYNIRDIYYPYVGEENHARGCISRTGVFVDGRLSWLSDSVWRRTMRYEQDTLVTEVVASSEEMGLTLTFHDAVCYDYDIFVREVHIRNHANQPRDVRLFFHYDFLLMDTEQGGTVYYHPELAGLMAYQGQRYLLSTGESAPGVGISDWTVGRASPGGEDGVWRDAEDGELQRVPISWGSTGGVIALRNPSVPAGGEATMYHWLLASTTFHGIEGLQATVRTIRPGGLIRRTRDYWRAWVRREPPDLQDLPGRIAELYRRSLLVMRCHADNRGAIIAGADSDVIQWLQDAYTYVWGRDGAYVAQAFDVAGHGEVSRRFYDFCSRVITSDGYLLHKYTPSGCLASHWIPWADREGNLTLPIQEDSTAVVVRGLWKHYLKHQDLEFVRPHYPRLVGAVGNFLIRHRDETTGLPAMSWDLWEMRRGIHTYTVATVWAALQAAANFAHLFGDTELGEGFQRAAAQMKEAAARYLVDEETGRFLRSLEAANDGSLVPDLTLDVSTCAPLLFGMFDPGEPVVQATVRALREALWCNTRIGGVARFENDEYFRSEGNAAKVPGNPWIVSTMWMAQCSIAMARTEDDLQDVSDLLNWAADCALPSGVLAEQVDPDSGAPVNVTPLAWSHAEFVITTRKYLSRRRELKSKGRR